MDLVDAQVTHSKIKTCAANCASTSPHSARIWNYWLGGKDNYAPDREVGDAVAAQNPDILLIARASRQFLVRAVTYLSAEAGIDQFLDIGAGLPTMNNTHEVAQANNPAARTVYVDNDPMVLAHGRSLLACSRTDGLTRFVHADVRDPESIIAEAANTLDFARPVAVLLLGVLGHATPDFDHMREVVAGYVDAIAPGQLPGPPGWKRHQRRRPRQRRDQQLRAAHPRRVPPVLRRLELVEPGVVPTTLWRPPFGTPAPVDSYGIVGRKP